MTNKLPNVAKSAPSVPAAFDGEIFSNVGKYARGAVLYAFEQVGGPDGLATWAEDNKDDFYTKLFPKIIARESEVTHHKTVDQLMDIIDGDYEIDGVIDDGDIDLPASVQAIEPIAPNWNATDYDYDNDLILAGDVDVVDLVDLVDFEE